MTIFTGTDGNDILTGNDGNNWLNGGAGHDVLTGGGGADVFVVDHGARNWRTTNWVMDFEQGRDKLYYGPHPLWYQQIDTTGNGAPDSTAIYHDAQGRSGSDAKTVVAVLKGVTGRLTVDDFQAGAGRPSDVTAIPQAFVGAPGNDILTGNDANNRLDGGGGHDRLTGGGGADVFTVAHLARSWQSANWVMDFEQGLDRLLMGSYQVWYLGIDTTGDGAVDSTVVYHQAHGRSNYTNSHDYPVLAVLKGFTGTLTVDDFYTDDVIQRPERCDRDPAALHRHGRQRHPDRQRRQQPAERRGRSRRSDGRRGRGRFRGRSSRPQLAVGQLGDGFRAGLGQAAHGILSGLVSEDRHHG